MTSPPPADTSLPIAPPIRRSRWHISKSVFALLLLTVGTLQLTMLDLKLSPQESGRPRNVLLITIDSLRADRLGCYGHPQAHTPNLDALAADGVRFDAAYAQASWTWPSVNSIMTSTYVTTHGAWSWNLEISRLLKTLPSLLASKGYACEFISAHSGLSGQHALTRDMVPVINSSIAALSSAVSTAMTNSSQQRFFMWAHLMETHHTAIEYDNGRFLGRADYPARYDRGVANADATVGAIIRALRELGLYEQTLVIVTADHGEGLGDGSGGFEGHGFLVTEELLRVPLIMVHAPAIPAGTICKKLVEQVDIAPTVCDAIDIARAPTFEGHSLLPLLRGDVSDSQIVYSENVGYNESEPGGSNKRKDWKEIRTSARTHDWKLLRIEEPGDKVRYELYHISVDPEEKVDLSTKENERLADMVSMLDAWRRRPRAVTSGQPRVLDEKQREDLKNLHYEI